MVILPWIIATSHHKWLISPNQSLRCHYTIQYKQNRFAEFKIKSKLPGRNYKNRLRKRDIWRNAAINIWTYSETVKKKKRRKWAYSILKLLPKIILAVEKIQL